MTNIFRPEYRELSEQEKTTVNLLKDKAQELLNVILVGSTTSNGREMALAKTKLEESVMWAVKGITGPTV